VSASLRETAEDRFGLRPDPFDLRSPIGREDARRTTDCRRRCEGAFLLGRYGLGATIERNHDGGRSPPPPPVNAINARRFMVLPLRSATTIPKRGASERIVQGGTAATVPICCAI